MRTFVFLALFAAAAVAYPAPDDRTAETLKYDSDNIGVGPFGYSYQTSNGINSQTQGELKAVDNEREALVLKGTYSYTAPDGQVITVTYTADENGYHPNTQQQS